MSVRRPPLGIRSLPEEVRAGVGRAHRALGDRRATPNLAWVAALSGARRPEIVRILAELGRLVPIEEEIRHRHLAAGRPSYAQIRAPFELYALVRLLRPERIVELGVSSGVSSAHFLAGLRRNHRGRLYSIDLPTRQRGARLGAREPITSLPPGCDSGWSVPDLLRDRWDLRIGPTEERLPGLLAEIGPVDLFLHDDRHTPAHLAFELETVRPHLAPGAVVLADNTAWTGEAFPRFARSVGVRVLRRGRGDLVGLRMPRPLPL